MFNRSSTSNRMIPRNPIPQILLPLVAATILSACWQSPNPTTPINPRAGLRSETSSRETPGVATQSLGGNSKLQINEYGKVTLSVDGIGTNAATGILSVEKPAGATVRKAYLAAASIYPTTSLYIMPQNGIKIDGVGINNWVQDTNNNNGLENAIGSRNYFANVTEIVRAKLDAAPAGRVDFTISELDSAEIDGEILAVVFDDPNQNSNNSVVLMFGSQEPDGDTFNLLFASPIVQQPNFKVDFSLGITYSARNQNSQTSVVDVTRIDPSGTPQSPRRLTSDAGGPDDGLPNPNQTQPDNGALITVGGLGDSNANPTDPNSESQTDARNDDELYNLAPFMQNGDTKLKVLSNNISGDDNIFFAAFAVQGASAVVNDGITLAPVTALNPVGASHTVTATIQNLTGKPIVGQKVDFRITVGPNKGTTGSGITDANGQATFTYSSDATATNAAGTDEITASYIVAGARVSANKAFKTWIYPEQITLAPPEETHPAGSTHTVTALVTNTIGEPGRNREVSFNVISGPHAGQTGTGTTDANGNASFTYTGPNIGTDTIQAKFTDSFAMEKPSNTVKVNWVVTQSITLEPATATNPVGAQHSVTATVTDSLGKLVVNTDITIDVVTGPHAGKTATITSDSNGQASLTYTGTGIGTDTITAKFVDNLGTTKTSRTVEANWTLIEKIKLEPLTATSVIGTLHTVTASLEDGLARPVIGRPVSFKITSGPNAGLTGSGTSDANGKATYTYPGTIVGTDIISSSFTGAAVTGPNSLIASNTVEKIWTGRAITDIKCGFENYGKNPNGTEFFEVRVSDSQVGLKSIRITTQTNMNVIVPVFTPGSREAQVIRATQINPALSTVLALEVTNTNGETLACDPAATIAIREKGRPVSETFYNVLHDEGTLRLTNGTPGLKRLEVIVNGVLFVLENLVDGEIRYLNILSALKPSDDNVITVKANGVTGASGDVLIWDGK
jgi:Bacterial Ig-like domain (group 1)